ncbi:MAG: hypothetical protein NC037_06500 [Bacteroides sp.]|nr:hypothetical protein [Bacillota bacterium]MCM1456154.1 hypothetical protein [Bacteroides sp.]
MSVYEHCKNCKYFLQFYTLHNFHFRLSRGTCACANLARHSSKLLKHCEFWEQKENTPEQTKKDVIETIYEINEKLYEILEVLNLDKD